MLVRAVVTTLSSWRGAAHSLIVYYSFKYILFSILHLIHVSSLTFSLTLRQDLGVNTAGFPIHTIFPLSS